MTDPVVDPEPLLDAPLDPPVTETPDGGGGEARLEGLADRPEVLVGGAFAGGILLSLIARRLGR